MPDAIARRVIETALQTRKSHPGAPALDVLDLAMRGHEGSDFDFAADGQPWADWLDPPSPFAELLRAALAPDMPAGNLALWDDPNDVIADGFREHWQAEVIEPFAARYQLWGG